MSSIDNRIVDMRFNNQQFENGIKTSVKSLDNLKKGLDLSGAARNLNELQRAGNRFSLSGIATGVETISNKFELLGIIGVTALQRITNAALNTGQQVAAALTLDPITDGFSEYEMKMNSIQTLLTNTADKGTTIEDVNAALAELNDYADKTIYNFGQMTDNASKFAAAGLTLTESLTNVKGLGNVAAGFGVSPEKMAAATYQMTQAMQSGRVIWQDWNSMAQAGMGGKKLQDEMKATARSMGILIDEGVSFKDSLEKGWLTAEVFTKTMARMAEDPALLLAATNVTTFTKLLGTMKESMGSGWAVTWEKILGDKNESTALFTGINTAFSKIVGSSADARNNMLQFWKTNGGRTALLQALSNALTGLALILEPIEKAFTDIFPAVTAKRLIELTKGFRDLMASFKIGEETSSNIKSTFKGLFALLDIGKMALFAVGDALMSVIKYLLPVGDGLLSVTGNLGDFIVYIRDALKSSNTFAVGMSVLGKIFKPIGDGIVATIKLISDTFKSLGSFNTQGLAVALDKVKERFEPFVTLVDFVGVVIARVKSQIQVLIKELSKAGGVFDKVRGAFNKLTDAIRNISFDSILDVVNGGLLAAALTVVLRFTSGVKKAINKLLKDFGEGGPFKQIVEGFKQILAGTKQVLEGVTNSLVAFQSQLKASTLFKIATAIAILAASLIALSMVDSKKLTVAMAAMTAMFANLFGSMAIFQKIVGATDFTSLMKLTASMVVLSTAILVLSFAMTKLATLDWPGIAKGLVSMIGLVGVLAGASKLLQGTAGVMVRSSVGFIAFGVALRIFITSIERLGQLDTQVIMQGIIGVAAALLEIVLFTKLMRGSSQLISTAIGITILGTSLLILSTAISKMGNMSWNTITNGLMAMAGSLTIIAVAVRMMPGNMFVTGAGLIVIASSLLILSTALSKMGGMSWKSVATGLVTLAGSLTIIAAAMYYMVTALPGAAALVIIAGALAMFTPTLILLGSMSLSNIGTGLLALVGVFAVLGLAAYTLGPLVPVIIGLGAAITLLGLGAAAVGVGILAFSAALTALAVSGAAGAAALVVIITSIVGLIPLAAKTLAQGVINFVKAIGEGAPTIAIAIEKLIRSMAKTFVDTGPIMVDSLFKLLDIILDTFNKYLPKLVDSGLKLIIAFLKGIRDNIGAVYTTALEIVINYLKAIATMLPDVIDAGINLIISFIDGLAEGIRKNTDRMIAAMENLIDALVEAGIKSLNASIDRFTEVGSNIVKGLINGMTSQAKNVTRAASQMAGSIIDTAKDVLGIKSPSTMFKEIGNNIIDGLTISINNNSKKAETASSNMSKKVVAGSQKVVKTSNDSAKKAFDKSVEWIDERKYYNKLSLKEELEAWESVQKRYIQGSDERKKADREVYRVKNELIKSQFNNSVNWIDDEKYYNKLALTDELAAWKRVQAKYLAGTDERKRADREVYKLEQEINATNKEYSSQVIQTQKETTAARISLEQDYYSKTKEINDKLRDDIRSLADEYERAVESRASALYNSYGMFDKVEAKEQVSGAELINNLQDQVYNLDLWKKQLDSLAIKGVDTGLISELQDLGPKSVGEIQALNRLSQPELDSYVSLWKNKHKLAKTQAISELEGMRLETLNKITELQTQSETELDTYRSMWANQMLKLQSSTISKLAEIKTEWLNKIGTLRTKTENEFVTLIDNVKTEITKPDWSSLGADIIGGIINGVKSKSMLLNNEIANTGRQVLRVLGNVWNINSPSKEFEKLGIFAIEGLVQGIKKYSGLAMNAGSEIGRVTKESLKSTFGNMAELLSLGLDLNPTIRPVLDLSNINAGKGQINSMFSGVNGIRVNDLASSINSSKQDQNGISSVTSGGPKEIPSVSNSFSIANLVVREEADVKRIARQLYQLQVAGDRG